MKMTIWEATNFLILQWFFIRVGLAGSDGHGNEFIVVRFPVVPLTGWIGGYWPKRAKTKLVKLRR